MDNTRQIRLHTSNGWETAVVPHTPQQTNQNLTSSIKPYEWFQLPQGSDVFRSNDYYRQIAYACINARAEKLVTADLKLKAIKFNRDFREVKTHPFYDLMANPNIYKQSFAELIYLVSISLDLSDNGAFLYAPKNKLGMPIGLYWLPSQNVSFEFNADRTRIAKYKYTWGANILDYNPEEIIHFRIPNPYNLFYSKSTASAARLTLNAEHYQLTYQESFYKNDAAIGMIFTLPVVNGKPVSLTETEFNRLNNQIKERFSGPDKAGKHLLAEGGMDAKRAESTPREADYSDSHQDTRNEVCGLFRVPKSILGFAEDVNRANAEAANVSFIQNTINPFSFHIWDKIDQFLKVSYDERLYLEWNYDLQEERQLQLENYEKGHKTWLLTNEIRRDEGRTEIPGLDDIEIAAMKGESNGTDNNQDNNNNDNNNEDDKNTEE